MAFGTGSRGVHASFSRVGILEFGRCLRVCAVRLLASPDRAGVLVQAIKGLSQDYNQESLHMAFPTHLWALSLVKAHTILRRDSTSSLGRIQHFLTSCCRLCVESCHVSYPLTLTTRTILKTRNPQGPQRHHGYRRMTRFLLT